MSNAKGNYCLKCGGAPESGYMVCSAHRSRCKETYDCMRCGERLTLDVDSEEVYWNEIYCSDECKNKRDCQCVECLRKEILESDG